jgi:hypothetical protein
VCTRDTCCPLQAGKGLCFKVNVCGNSSAPRRMFVRGAGKMGKNEVIGNM